MSDLSLTNTLVAGTPEDIGDVQQNFTDIVTWANGNVDADNFTATTNQNLGLSETGTVRRGKAIIATEQSTSSTTYTTLTTPDRVQNLVLPTDGLICVAYQGMWKESVNAAGSAAIFIGSDQIKIATAGQAAPQVVAAGTEWAADTYGFLVSDPRIGLYSGPAGTGATAYTGDVTTGQLIGGLFSVNSLIGQYVGGVATIFAAAGTYTVSVQYKATSGSVTAKNRKLWCWTVGFG